MCQKLGSAEYRGRAIPVALGEEIVGVPGQEARRLRRMVALRSGGRAGERAGTGRGKQHRRHKREEYPTPLPRGPHVHGNPLSATLRICDKSVGSCIRGPTYCRGAPNSDGLRNAATRVVTKGALTGAQLMRSMKLPSSLKPGIWGAVIGAA